MNARKVRAILALYDTVVAFRYDIGERRMTKGEIADYCTGCALLDSFGIVIEGAV